MTWKKLSKHGRRSVWMNREHMTELKCKKRSTQKVETDMGYLKGIETLPRSAGMKLGKFKLSSSWN